MHSNDTQDIEEYYDKLSASYDGSHSRGYFESINRFEMSLLEDKLQGKIALEIGCGTGILLERASKKASSAIGIDLSSKMLRKAAQRTLSVSKADAIMLPFKDNSFDVIYSFKALSHIPRLESAFVEMTRVMKENGLAFLEIYNSHSMKSLVQKAKPTKTFTRYYSISEVEKALPPGVELLKVEGFMVFTPSCVLYQVPLLGKALDFIEKAASKTGLRRFASHVILVCRKKPLKVKQ